MNETIEINVVSNPGVHGGRPCIVGTGVSVQRIVGWHRLCYSAEEIARLIGHISIGDVYFALAYYDRNRDKIDPLLEQEHANYARLAREFTAAPPA